MSRLLLIALGMALVFWVLRAYRRSGRQPAQPLASQEMVACAHCGLHVPKNEAVASGKHYFCCEQHRREHAARAK